MTIVHNSRYETGDLVILLLLTFKGFALYNICASTEYSTSINSMNLIVES